MFFQHISQVMSPGVDLNLTIGMNETGGLVVLVKPNINGLKDPAQNKFIPLTLKGTPQELDTNFISAISAPVQKTSGILLNMAAYEKQSEAAAAASKAEKDKKDQAAKEAREQKTKYDEHMKKADEWEKAGKNDSAIVSLLQAKNYATDKQKKTVDEKIASLRTVSLFDNPVPVTQPVRSTPSIPVTSGTSAPANANHQGQSVSSPQVQQAVSVPTGQTSEQPAATAVASPTQPITTQPTGAVQPNVQGFAIFAQPPTQPVNTATDHTPVFEIESESFAGDGEPVCRPEEYAEYPDFPMEMQPPLFNTAPN